MTALLTDNLPLLAGSPNGIKKLRELILELAVRGKLVPQDPSDESASELLKRIAEEKARMVADGKIKNPKPLASLNQEEQSGDLPEGWALSRLGEVVNICTGKLDANAAVPGGEYPFFTCSQTPSSIATYSFETAAVLLAGNGDFNLKKYQGRFDAYQRTYVIEPVIWSLDFCFISVSAEIERITENNRGSAIPYLKLGDITNPVIWMPPLAEQHRIVAKVDELMTLCDRLEAQQADADSAHAQLVQTLLDSLSQASDAADFAQSWQRLAEHFHTLFTTESSIDALKQTLLQLAVMGKLVPQDPSDEPASELLKRIAEEKARLVAEGKLKKQKPLAEIDESEMSFELPLGWKWQRFADFALDVSTGPFGSLIHQSDYVNGGVPLVNPSHMIDGRIVADSSVSLLPDMAASLNSYRLSAGDIVMARRGEVGRAALVTEAEEGWLCGTGSFVLRFTSEISRAYVWILFRCHSVRTYLAGAAVGTTMVNLNHGILLKMPIAVPPITEQHRIVAKVDQLMALCDQLKTRLNQVRQVHEQLAGALVEQAVA